MSNDSKPHLAVREWLCPVLGSLLLLIGVGLAAVVERGQIEYSVQLKRHGGDVLDLGSSGRPDASEQGYMVRVVGPLQVVEAPLDQQFNQQVNQPVLIRHVQMFQWRELRYGGPPSYELDWEDHPIDSSQFQRPGGHANPGKFPIESAQFEAGLVRLNGFALSPTLVHALVGSQPVTPDLRSLPGNLAASFSLYQRGLVTSAEPSRPRVGDLRVTWEAVPVQTVTIVAKVDGNKLIPASNAVEGAGFAVQSGDVTLTNIFPDLPLPPEHLWFERVFAWLLAVLGSALLVQWHYRRIDPVLAPSAALLMVGAVDGALWMGHANAAMAGWFVVVLIGAALTAWRVRALGTRD